MGVIARLGPLTLTEHDLQTLRGINEKVSLQEVEEIYLPSPACSTSTSRPSSAAAGYWNSFSVSPRQGYLHHQHRRQRGGGKSTTARIMQALLERWPEHPRVELVTTDGFLYPNKVLEERGLMRRKGFPESYDIRHLVEFVANIRAGHEKVEAPVYSHLIYDIIPDEKKVVEQPDILILEGLNVLQSGMDYPQEPHRVFVSDFVDFSIYVDAEAELLRTWYIERFLKFRSGAFSDPDSYFHHYAKLAESEATKIANNIWQDINYLNLKENILPTRERANLILTKGNEHAIEQIKLRK